MQQSATGPQAHARCCSSTVADDTESSVKTVFNDEWSKCTCLRAGAWGLVGACNMQILEAFRPHELITDAAALKAASEQNWQDIAIVRWTHVRLPHMIKGNDTLDHTSKLLMSPPEVKGVLDRVCKMTCLDQPILRRKSVTHEMNATRSKIENDWKGLR